MNITANKKRSDYVARTFCDFGGFDPFGPPNNRNQPDRKNEESRHFSLESAQRQFKRLYNTYKRGGWIAQGWRIWTEDRRGNILFDSKKI